jgi:hypothetical protein
MRSAREMQATFGALIARHRHGPPRKGLMVIAIANFWIGGMGHPFATEAPNTADFNILVAVAPRWGDSSKKGEGRNDLKTAC